MAERIRDQLFIPDGVPEDARWRAITDAWRPLAGQVNLLSQDTVAVNADAVLSENLVLANASAGALALTLIPALDYRDQIMAVKKIDATANLVLIGTTGGELIDGGTTATISVQYQTIRLQSDGSQWWKV